MSHKNNARLIYSTDTGGKCAVCGWPQRNCQCSSRRATNDPIPARIPCDECEHACVAALGHALAAPDDWRHWLAIRDACPAGRSHRYDERQILYHYTKDRAVLRQAAGAQQPSD